MTELYRQAARETREAFKLQTVAVGIWHDGKEEYHTFGHVSPKTPHCDKDTIYPIASLSKSFIAAAVWILADEGKIDVTAPLAQYLPDFAMYTEELTQQLTVRDAMCHCSGLPRHDLSMFMRANMSLEEFVRLIRWLPTAWPLHARFGYSNHMFAAVSLLVQRVSGMPWEDFVNERIFKRLGMSRSYAGTFAYRDIDDNYARPRMLKNGVNRPTEWEKVACCGCSGSICASVTDMMQWLKLNLRQGVMANGQRLFSEQAASQLYGNQTPIGMKEMYPFELKEVAESNYCMGWIAEKYRGERFIHHGGTLSGFKSIAGFLPEKDFAFVVLANSANTGGCDVLGRKLCDIYLGHENADWDTRYKTLSAPLIEGRIKAYIQMKEPPDKEPDINGLTGQFENKAYGMFTVRRHNGKLSLHTANVKHGMPLLPSKQFGWIVDIPWAGLALPCRFEMSGKQAVRLLAHMDGDLPEPIIFERVKS